jgi:hypothetical protein
MRTTAPFLAVVFIAACHRAEEKPKRDDEQAKTSVAPKGDASVPAPPDAKLAPKEPAACGWLDRFGAASDHDAGPLRTSGWKNLGLGWSCYSDFWRLPDGAGVNNLTYYVSGEADRATLVRLRLNVNDRAYEASALKTLVDAAELVTKQPGMEMPANVRLALSQGREVTAGPFKVTHDAFPSPKKGYQIEFSRNLD